MDEPGPKDPTVDMLAALPREDSEFYAHEKNVVSPAGKSLATFHEIEQHYALVGGSQREYLRYLHRSDLSPNMWRF